MLGQVISKSIRAFVSKNGLATNKVLPFGTIVFVVSVGPAGKAKIIHEDMIYRVPVNSLEFLKSEKDILSWKDIERREEQKRQRIIDSIQNLVIE